MKSIRTFASTFALISALALPAQAEQFSPEQKKEIEQIIQDYLSQHPEVLEEMAKALEAKQKVAQAEQQKQALAKHGKAIFHSKGDFSAGNPKGSVAIVEFFDYNCGWCKKGFPEVLSLVENDSDVRLVLKEFPIFGADSEYAARAAIAAGQQNKYWELHSALFGHEGKVTQNVVDEAAQQLGLDMNKLKADMESAETTAILAQNQSLAQELAINGTPAFVIGKELIPGYLPSAELAATINDVRKNGSCNNLC